MKYCPIFLLATAIFLFSCKSEQAPSKDTSDASEMTANDTAFGTQQSDEDIKSQKEVALEKEVETTSVGDAGGSKMEVFDPDYINGKWIAEDQNGFSFDAWFDSKDGMVFGQYCAMNYDATRIDCGTHDEIASCYLRSGPIAGKKELELEVVSCYSMKKGKAVIHPQEDGNLVWRLMEPPGEFGTDHFAPEVVLLRKTTFDPYE